MSFQNLSVLSNQLRQQFFNSNHPGIVQGYIPITLVSSNPREFRPEKAFSTRFPKNKPFSPLEDLTGQEEIKETSSQMEEEVPKEEVIRIVPEIPNLATAQYEAEAEEPPQERGEYIEFEKIGDEIQEKILEKVVEEAAENAVQKEELATLADTLPPVPSTVTIPGKDEAIPVNDPRTLDIPTYNEANAEYLEDLALEYFEKLPEEEKKGEIEQLQEQVIEDLGMEDKARPAEELEVTPYVGIQELFNPSEGTFDFEKND